MMLEEVEESGGGGPQTQTDRKGMEQWAFGQKVSLIFQGDVAGEWNHFLQ